MEILLNQIADAINSVNPRNWYNEIHIKKPFVGMKVGCCKNCKAPVVLRQPWLSEDPIVNDGWYIIRCENERCHNCYGMELQEKEMGLADFVDWDEEVVERKENEDSAKIIPFPKMC